jgi:hypothetical protein
VLSFIATQNIENQWLGYSAGTFHGNKHEKTKMDNLKIG